MMSKENTESLTISRDWLLSHGGAEDWECTAGALDDTAFLFSVKEARLKQARRAIRRREKSLALRPNKPKAA
jgi:hypothetical protein